MFHVSQVSRRPPYQVESETHSSRKYMSLVHYRFLASLQSMMVISSLYTGMCTCPKGNRGTHTTHKYGAYISWTLVSRYFIVFKNFTLALQLLGLRYFSIHECTLILIWLSMVSLYLFIPYIRPYTDCGKTQGDRAKSIHRKGNICHLNQCAMTESNKPLQLKSTQIGRAHV